MQYPVTYTHIAASRDSGVAFLNVMLEIDVRFQMRGRVDGVMDTSGQGWLMFLLPVNIYVVVNGVVVAFLSGMLEIGVRFQMRC
ncbi:hypothetical protein OUZ56_025425 [Daphnia magna]|uniref:Uncharacterized protein n=1 Tax=Daphnia magna TaxID=35525 RepID=A0ABQ9ZJU2_9CRUS|nr:hypothetical protein OUZ56_025425 [Daphnia magna]